MHPYKGLVISTGTLRRKLNTMRRLFFVIPSVLMLLGLVTSPALAQDPANGQTAWEEQVWQCQRCHGPQGEGLFARPLSNSTLTEDEWIDQVRNPRRFMPSFSPDQVSDQQIRDMHAYITALPDPAGEFQREDPGITATHPGQDLMVQKNCVACHTDAVTTGQGSPISRFVDRGETPTTEAVIDQLRTPLENMPAYSPDQVSDEEAAQIADYLAMAFANQQQAAPSASPQADQQQAAPSASPQPTAQQQAAPSTLPQSGGDTQTILLVILLVGGGLALAGFSLRRLMAKK
jgi:mono/diheme cytochrome c family protein